MKCPNCDSPVGAEARFCGECGQALKQLGKSLVEQPAVSSAPPASPGPDLSGLRTIDDMETRQPRSGPQRVMNPGDVFAARYEVKQLIGEGGMGVVYRAMDKLTEKDVALKLIRADRLAGKDAVKRLIREGVTSRDIRHQNVVAVYDVGEADGQPYMSMEFLAGQSLRAWTRKRLASSTDCSMLTAANIIAEILAGLDAAHKAGVVHRDLKPENVMLTGEPNDQGAQLKILDFGVARAVGSGDTGATSLGTRGYMAPEQITAPDAAQPSADLYSLSVMFYELLVGVVPQGHWQPPSGGRSDVPPAIDKLIERGLSNNPRVRPQTIAEYGKALADAMNVGAGQANFAPWLKKLEDTAFKPLIDGLKNNMKDAGAHTALPSSGPTRQGKENMFQLFFEGVTRKYMSGAGRASRMEYWTLGFGVVIAAVLGYMFDVAAPISYIGYDPYNGPIASPVFAFIIFFALMPPLVAVTARRIHDLGQPASFGKAMALSGAISMMQGTPGPNAYGPDPLGGA